MKKGAYSFHGDFPIDSLPLSVEAKAALRGANLHYVGHIRSSHHLHAGNLAESLPGCTDEIAREIVEVLPELGSIVTDVSENDSSRRRKRPAENAQMLDRVLQSDETAE